MPMYSDNSLLPKETIRLAALGMLSDGGKTYGELANEIRHFISRIVGPSLELMGTSIELLRYEGLIASDGEGEDALLSNTDAGRTELGELLQAAIRPPFNDLNKLAMSLKIRFLHLLERDGRRDQADMMIDASRSEVARLTDLQKSQNGDPGYFSDWLDHDIGLAKSRLTWLEDFRAKL
jgi:DNA-binding PadR family transcriptional regulator